MLITVGGGGALETLITEVRFELAFLINLLLNDALHGADNYK